MEIEKNENYTPIPKGEFTGECNRTACDNKYSQWYNKVMDKYYCGKCADMINQSSNQSGQGDLCEFYEKEDLIP